MKKYKLLIIIISVGLLLGAGFLLANRSSQESTGSQNQTASIFSLDFQNYSGEKVVLSNFQGKPLVINAWAAWCPFCVQELKDFAAVQKEFGNKITIIAIDRAEPKEVVKQYTDQLGISENLVFLLDPNDSFYRTIGGFSMPETILIDKNGEVFLHQRGPMDLQEMQERINQLLSA